MTKIIIGKQGDQKFPIKNAGVSRQHASITIEGGHWILEDRTRPTARLCATTMACISG